jgi:hypothetical protein
VESTQKMRFSDGRRLLTSETVEHRIRIAKTTVPPIFLLVKLFQANTQRPARISTETNFRGTHLRSSKKYYVASIQEYTVDGPATSVTRKKYFSIKILGEKGALDAAKAWRTAYTLIDGMVVERAP